MPSLLAMYVIKYSDPAPWTEEGGGAMPVCPLLKDSIYQDISQCSLSLHGRREEEASPFFPHPKQGALGRAKGEKARECSGGAGPREPLYYVYLRPVAGACILPKEENSACLGMMGGSGPTCF